MINKVKFKDLEGKVITKIDGKVGDEELVLHIQEGKSYKMFHERDCCEEVRIEDICGDISDLIGTPVLLAEEVTSDKDPEGYKSPQEYRDSFTWTFYKLATIKGSVTIRWLGGSNGYYSESVTFVLVQ